MSASLLCAYRDLDPLQAPSQEAASLYSTILIAFLADPEMLHVSSAVMLCRILA
ncbi:hypothetical protein M407DRAFT_22399 [Tulasnella calospora MUT 4182]|uniref:Uncharacterized protein n=1 Tax=Tulasnella calospora MUT 4182 TaxID=1051891 RepID=A0A0C3QN03_9AGAM|nr:hypothetical protein M407DRAFT_22399 [Tulasnella calospora MUT 4182]